MHFCDDKNCTITPDSGTSCMTFPSWAYHKAMNAGYLKSRKHCNHAKDIGNITFVINGEYYTLDSRHYFEVKSSIDLTRVESARIRRKLHLRNNHFLS